MQPGVPTVTEQNRTLRAALGTAKRARTCRPRFLKEGFEPHGVKNYSKGPCVTILE